MALHDYGYLPPKFLRSYPVCGFLLGIFSGGGAKSIVMQISFAMLIFLLFLNKILGRGKLLEGQTGVSRTMYQNTERSCFIDM